MKNDQDLHIAQEFENIKEQLMKETAEAMKIFSNVKEKKYFFDVHTENKILKNIICQMKFFLETYENR